MTKQLALNNRDLPWLDGEILNALFESVYSSPGAYEAATEAVLHHYPEQLRRWFDVLKYQQEYNRRFRINQCYALMPVVDPILGPFQTNSEGPDFWLALVLSVQESYGLSKKALSSVLHVLYVRK